MKNRKTTLDFAKILYFSTLSSDFDKRTQTRLFDIILRYAHYTINTDVVKYCKHL